MPRLLRREEGPDDPLTAVHVDPDARGAFVDGLVMDGRDPFAERRRISREMQAARLALEETSSLVAIKRACGHVTLAPPYLNELARLVYQRTPCAVCVQEALIAERRREQAAIDNLAAVATG